MKWFREPAKCYSRKLTRDLDKWIDSSRKKMHEILQNEIASLNQIMFSMPEVPGGPPKEFASAYDDPSNREKKEEEEDDDDVVILTNSPIPPPIKKRNRRKRKDVTTTSSSKRKRVKQKEIDAVIANQATWQFHGGNGSNDWIDMDTLCTYFFFVSDPSLSYPLSSSQLYFKHTTGTEKLEMALSKNVSQLKLIPTGCRTLSHLMCVLVITHTHIKTHNRYGIFNIWNQRNEQTDVSNKRTNTIQTLRTSSCWC